MIKVAIVGAGKGGSYLLEVFHINGEVKVVGITDRDNKAPGLNLAKEWGVFIANDVRDLFSQSPEIVINTTGEPKVSVFIKQAAPYPVEIIEGTSAKFLWDLVKRQQLAKNDMGVLYQNGITITKAVNLKEVLDKVLKSALKLTETPAGSIALIDGDEMVMAAHRGLSREFFKEQRWQPRKDGLTYRILKDKEPVEFQDTEKEPLLKGTKILQGGIKSLLASPLLLDEGIVGILYLDDFKPREFTERHKNLIKIFSSFAAQAIEKFKLMHELEESFGYLQGVLDDSQDMIATTDNKGRIVKFSKGGGRILGYRADEVIGRNAAEFYVDKEERAKILEALKEEGAVFNYETKLQKKDGSHVDISLTISRLRDKAGNIIGTVGVSKDITEEKQLREKLKDKNKELEELTQSLEEKVLERTRELEKINRELRRANEIKGRFIANMSHELRTPLHSIVGFSEVLLDRAFGDINEKQQKHITNILNSGKHLLHLVNNILDLAKIEAGRIELSCEICSLKDVTNEVLMVVKHLADRKHIELKTDISHEVPNFTADKVKFKQILYNLLSNAVKFTPESGSVGVRTEKFINGDLFPWAGKGQEFLKLSVWDTGIGIRAEDIERVFDEFEQLDPSKATEGTGLGLSLTKKLVELHGGYIDAESDFGKGSTFNVYIPVVMSEQYEEEKQELPEAIAAIADDAVNAPLVLVVEDDIPTSELLAIHLSKAGYRTVHAYNGVEAIRLAKEVQPFAITLDIMLPRKNGWEVLQSLKADSETSDIPVIIHSIIDNKELGFALGAVDYIVKPLDKANILSRLEHISSATKKKRYPVTVLTVTGDAGIQKHFQNILGNEGFLVHSAANSQEGINLALATNPNLAIIDLNIPEGGFNLIKTFKENPATKMMPLFALTSSALSEEESLSMTGQIEKVLRKDALSSKALITHLRDLEVLHPKRAGLIDEITGIFNHRYFQIRLAQETSRARRYNLPFVIAIFGVDYFTHYTNRHGEYYGNLALRKVSELLRKNIRGSDVVVRYGSDAFAMILTNTYLSSGIALCKRALATIHDYPFLKEEGQPSGRLTASAGILEFSGQSAEELIQSAEKALSLAVEKGRNRAEAVI
ncbi:MAG: diguanylate cyclase [Nitrospiraceae bacterium]|nr:MAG: diguanylate cyclase [Nitrospiraceae bacterium]